MHTPEQAKALWCPMVRHDGDDGGCFNRSVNNIDPINYSHSGGLNYGCHCIANQCAMWRWLEFESMTSLEIAKVPLLHGGGEREVPVTKQVGVKGYCGLAGRPA